jgi:hypothetical protein
MNKETQLLYQITSSAAAFKIKCWLTVASPDLENMDLYRGPVLLKKAPLNKSDNIKN